MAVLVVDDDRSIPHLVTKALASSQIETLTAQSGKDALEILQKRRIDVVLLDFMLPDVTGLDLFREIRAIDPKMPVVIITVMGGSDTAIEAMKLGAFDYLAKPLDLDRVETLVRQALEIRRLRSVPVELDAQTPGAGNADLMIGNSSQMLEVYKTVGRVASQDIPVLILGESGTGKELVARAIYQHGNRANGPFLALNCAAIPESLLESELFGHEKGAFTGATSQRIGKFEQCARGTIFLDEIGDMPLLLQSKILRVLQEQSFERVGGNQTIRADVRIVAATHRDLETMVARNEFRSDLFYRLNGVSIHLPPLRERRNDIATLVNHFLSKYRVELGQDVQSVAPEAMALLERYSWPGNIRELQSALRLALVQATGSVLIPEFFPREILGGASTPSRSEAGDLAVFGSAPGLENFVANRLKSGSEDLYAEALQLLEQQLLRQVLRWTQGNQSRAAKILGITRGNLRNKIRTLGLSIEQDTRIEDEASAATEA
jgi:two-component system nitrogen regulation response regulator GlnG